MSNYNNDYRDTIEYRIWAQQQQEKKHTETSRTQVDVIGPNVVHLGGAFYRLDGSSRSLP